jgi:hypothetical protein
MDAHQQDQNGTRDGLLNATEMPTATLSRRLHQFAQFISAPPLDFPRRQQSVVPALTTVAG